ncbi:hypothetical protein UFOVP679_4 [uncultured Caudovirales phage]|uniref:Uncharacterized protein n=1 Tax=uncultured Caudovirales phage TaxID=2100421 RepID=A0A6J5NI52_9CAUD|nr:hypothetical protein UFOVP679_4 [uncultured Caudovirales phage]
MMVAFGVACLLTYAINAWAAAHAKPKYADAVGVSVLFCVSYALSNLLVFLFHFPGAVMVWPLIDLGLLIMVARAWYKDPTLWKAVLSTILVGQLAAHAAFFFILQTGHATQGSVWTYALIMNVTFGLQLLTVGSAGVCHAVGVLRCAMSNRWRPHSVGNG